MIGYQKVLSKGNLRFSFLRRKILSEISRWLTQLSLKKYAAAFDKAEIDLETLPFLTDDDLSELGLPLGPRRKVLSAVQQTDITIAKQSEKTIAPAPSTPPQEVVPPTSSSDAERRHLTVMFVDLVGSTEMTAKIDPEDMRTVITNYQNTIAGIVARFEGFVAKFMGDGVLCYFGWPRANEDDAERAVRAGLAMIDAVKAMPGPGDVPLATRVGIATGVVIVGDLIGSGATQEAAVVGETPNLAARLLGIARPNQLVLPRATQKILGDIFELDPIGAHKLKGLAKPVDAYVVVGEQAKESRFAARQVGALTPIIGREQELNLVRECWTKAKTGSGQMIVVNGEAGIGKSRITQAAIDAIAVDDHNRITFQCSPYHIDSAFYPIIQQMNLASGIGSSDDSNTRLDKLEHLFGASLEGVLFLASLLGIDAADRYDPHNLTPSQLRTQIMHALVNLLMSQAKSKPLLIVFEDLHWIDPTTLEFIDLVLDAIANRPVLILSTARPAFEHGFGGHPIVTRFSLNRLGKEQILSIVDKLTGGKVMPEEVLQIIVSRTDGVPLFVEELTKAILETGVLKTQGDSLVLSGSLDTLAIPNTLHDSLMARLDRLQPIKEVAQVAACIGREFSHQLLMKISPLSEIELENALIGLIKAELVYRRGVPPEATYLFKHALVRDAAYESLLKERRRKFHKRILSVLIDDPETPPELSAFHASQAGLVDRAVELWSEAGSLAQAQPAYAEAINHIKSALEEIHPLLVEMNWRQKELHLLVRLAQIYVAKEGYQSKEASEAFAKALERIDVADSAELRVAIYYGTWIAPYIGCKLYKGLELANKLVENMEDEPETIPRLISHRMRAATLISMGRSVEALKDLDLAYKLYLSSELDDFSSKFAQDPGVQIWSYQLLAFWMIGDYEKAVQIAEKALSRSRKLQHANTFCYAGLHAVTLAIWMQDSARIRSINKEMEALAIEYDMVLWKTFCAVQDAVADCIEDKPNAAQKLSVALDQYRGSGCGLWITLYLAEMAKHQLRCGDIEGAGNTVASAMKTAEESGETWALAELYRVLGEVNEAMGNTDQARTNIQKAGSIAQAQQAPILATRAECLLEKY